MPEVTICIPAYNADKYLSETLDSVRNQSFLNWDMIVTEDGSKDRTEEIVNDFAKKVAQSVTYQRHSQNMGLSATRNTCIRTASSPLLAFLDSDDCWKPEHLETVVNIFKDPDTAIVHSGSILFESETGKKISIRAPSPQDVSDFPLSLYLHRYIIQPSSAVIHRRVFESVGGFDDEMLSVEDMEFWFRAVSNGFRFAYTGTQTCLYRKHGDALSENSLKMVHYTARAYEKHLLIRQLNSNS